MASFARVAVGVAVVAVAIVAAVGRTRADDAALQFVRDGASVARLDRATLERECGVRTVEIDDPYYGRSMTFFACPLARVLELGFGATRDQLEGKDFLLRARDGYVKPSTGTRLLEPGAYLALGDASLSRDGEPGWAPIDRRQVDPGPFYLVWQGAAQRDTNLYPWPYQLVKIEIGSIADEYPDVVPRTAPAGSAAWQGFAIFKTECVSCHAVNGQGGKVGPDLNVPQSIVEYRPIAQVKAYIRDPEVFRHTSMPAHRHLTSAQLDELIAYFEVMRTLKRDPGRTP